MSKGNGRELTDATALEGDGNVEMGMFILDGRIVMRFRRAMTWIGFDPSNAVAIGKHLIDLAVAAGVDVQIEVPSREISFEKRRAMVARVQHIYRSMNEKGRPPNYIAQQVVDSILTALD